MMPVMPDVPALAVAELVALETVAASLRKTGRAVMVDESPGCGGQVAAAARVLIARG